MPACSCCGWSVKEGIESSSWMCSATTSIPLAGSRPRRAQRGASEVESDPSSGTSTRRNAAGGSASGGTISTGLRSAMATAEAVPPSGLRAGGRSARADRERDDVARPRPPRRGARRPGPVVVRSANARGLGRVCARCVRRPSARAAPRPRRREASRSAARLRAPTCPRGCCPALREPSSSRCHLPVLMCLLDLPVGRRGGHAAAIDAEPKRPSAEAQRELERVPLLRQPRIDEQRSPRGRMPPNPNASACHSPPIVARCSPPARAAGQIVEVDAGPRSRSAVERRPVAAGAGEQRSRGSPATASCRARFAARRSRGSGRASRAPPRRGAGGGASARPPASAPARRRYARRRAGGRRRSAGAERSLRSRAARARRSRRTARR